VERIPLSILSSDQRAVIRVSTGIDQLVIDRVVEAYDALLADNREAYMTLMATAMAQADCMPGQVKQRDRPTAIDKMKTICIRRIADMRHWSFKRTAKYLEEATGK
jgi:hypothetical protein